MVKTFYFDGQKSLSYVINNLIIFGQSDRSRRRQQIKSKNLVKNSQKICIKRNRIFFFFASCKNAQTEVIFSLAKIL